jgi:hypothetical protein
VIIRQTVPFVSADGEEKHGCLERFVGAMAIARYAIRSRRPSSTPLSLRERVITIDNDSRMIARPPFERLLAVEREVVSDNDQALRGIRAAREPFVGKGVTLVRA